MKIVLSEGYQPYVASRFSSHETTFYSQSLGSSDEFLGQIAGAEALGVRWPIRTFRFDRQLVENLPELQFIHASGTGTDWFDVDALSDHGILLANNHGFNAPSVAEHTITLILLALRNTHWYIEQLAQGHWRRDEPSGGVVSLGGKTVGIVGMGESGSRVARASTALGAHVVAYQRSQPSGYTILGGVEWVSFHDLLRRSDIVSLHVPITSETERMIGKSELELMKPTAVLVNTSRGRVIDEDALYTALSSGRLRAAALDVFTQEPPPRDHPLLNLENVIATPHVGGMSQEVAEHQVEGTLDNIERFAAGSMPLRLVNPEILRSDHLRASHLRNSG